jgi:4-amino-4-deoxy-L-arabinose transferase-like glycosyltransferase
MTIDPLSIFFWAAALATCWRALEESPNFSWWWPVTGGLIGLGFLAKYTNAMQLLSIVLLLAITPKYRSELKRAGFAAMLGVFLICCIPVVIWNAQHDWVTLEHLKARGGLNKPFGFSIVEFGKFLALHFGVFSPLAFGAMIAAVVWIFPKAKHSFKARYLLAFTLPLFALYFWLSLKQAGEANWTRAFTRASDGRGLARARVGLSQIAHLRCRSSHPCGGDVPRHAEYGSAASRENPMAVRARSLRADAGLAERGRESRRNPW